MQWVYCRDACRSKRPKKLKKIKNAKHSRFDIIRNEKN